MQQLSWQAIREWALFAITAAGAAAGVWAIMLRPTKRKLAEFRRDSFQMRIDLTSQERRILESDFSIRRVEESLQRIETTLQTMGSEERKVLDELGKIKERLGIVESGVKRLEERETPR